MRVIAGQARGSHLRRVPGSGTRPISDRVKEALFNILAPRLRECRFADFFAGTGSVGIEALSRGARQGLFVERERAALRTIRQNLEHTRLDERAEIRAADFFRTLLIPPSAPFDILYIAPPQYRGIWLRALSALEKTPGWWHRESLIIVQIDPREREEIQLPSWEERDWRRYGNTALWFFAPCLEMKASD